MHRKFLVSGFWFLVSNFRCAVSRNPEPGTRNPLLLLGLALLLTSLNALGAESFEGRLAKGHALLNGGDTEGAMGQYRELQTEDPESEILYYSMGCAHYREGMNAVDQKDPQDAITSFQEARDTFGKVLNARDPEIRTKAAYDHANAVAQLAMQSSSAQKYEEAKTAFEDSVKEYEGFLKQHPNHEGARTNLDHVRYLLKSMLQNPPPPEQQQGQGEQKQDQNKQQGDQQKQDQKQQGQDNKDQEQKDQKDKQEEQKQQEQQQAQAAQAENAEDKDKQEKAEEDPKPEDHQNVEAILQSLEDLDNKQQQEDKNQRTGIKTPKDWW